MIMSFFNFIPTAHAQVGLDFLNLPANAEIGDVLARLYVFGVGIVAVSAMIMLVIGGVQYMTAGDRDPGSAKTRITNAIWGLVLALCSWLILYTINPDLTQKIILEPLMVKIQLVPPSGGPGGHSCTQSSECPSQYFCKVFIAATKGCRSARNGEPGTCLDNQCKPPQ